MIGQQCSWVDIIVFFLQLYNLRTLLGDEVHIDHRAWLGTNLSSYWSFMVQYLA